MRKRERERERNSTIFNDAVLGISANNEANL